MLTCETEGHEFTEWIPVHRDECQELLTDPGQTAVTGDGQPVSQEYRYCRRCCLHESRRDWMLISGLRGQNKNHRARQRLLAASADTGEVA